MIRFAGRSVIAAVWVDYEPGGVLSYRELMATVLVRRGWRVLPTITHIWVDSPASRAGGRALWGIPKGVASFAFEGNEFSASDEDGQLASAGPLAFLAGRRPVTSFALSDFRMSFRG